MQIGIEKRYIILGMILFGVVLFFGPFLINLLMFNQKLFPVTGDFIIWIPSLSTYAGALFGGLISGLITLYGVIFTINNASVKERENGLPKKLERAEELERSLLELKKILVSKEFLPKHDYFNFAKREVNKFVIERKLVDISINVSEPVYRKIKLMELSTYDMQEIKSNKFYLNKMNADEVQKVIDMVRLEKEKLLKEIFA
ncbi:hypothetical protein H9635_10135 [Solibacillus sp. A46]|uniref:Uncharacterized protein n=1 Tax=Solibacillus faecavium TaxID=2762221 RepID=A0ABR8XZ49_9BACL|nr:hypothetical protein [Solibacillus faecavium]MBD8037104.1 hypothetical protein [Solibacillus faecavium]